MPGTIIYTEGFDNYNGTGTLIGMNARWTNMTTAVQMATGRFGGQCVQSFTGSGSSWEWGPYRIFSDPYLPKEGVGLTGSIGFAFRYGVANWRVLGMGQAGGISITFLIGSDAKMHIYRGDVATWLCHSGAVTIPAGQWAYIELEFFINDTTGYVNLYIDNELVGSFTGDTKAGSETRMESLRIINSRDSIDTRIDDIYFTDSATRLGPCRVETIRPIADTATKDFIPLTGTANYAMVDEALADNTDYVQSGVIGAKDLYDFGNLSSTPAAIYAANLIANAVKTDAGARTMGLNIGSDAGPAMTLLSSSGFYTRNTQLNPATGLAWTAAEINAIQAGPEVTS